MSVARNDALGKVVLHVKGSRGPRLFQSLSHAFARDCPTQPLKIKGFRR